MFDPYLSGTITPTKDFTVNFDEDERFRLGLNVVTFTAAFENGENIETAIPVYFFDEDNLKINNLLKGE